MRTGRSYAEALTLVLHRGCAFVKVLEAATAVYVVGVNGTFSLYVSFDWDTRPQQ